MKLLALDPSLGHTGYAVLEGEDGTQGRIIEAGGFRLADGTHAQRIRELTADVAGMIERHRPDRIVIEEPWSKGRPPSAQSTRSAMTSVWYGAAVGACMAAACAKCPRVWGVPVDEWAKGMSTHGDPNKTKRVSAACSYYGLAPEALGVKSRAGDVADAILLGRWVMMRTSSIEAYGMFDEVKPKPKRRFVPKAVGRGIPKQSRFNPKSIPG
jgi:hypothetical protein